MLSVTATTADPLRVDADLLVVPVFKGGIAGPGTAAVLRALQLDTLPVTPTFRGDIGQHLTLAAPGLACGGVLLVGLGRMDATDPARLRRAAGVAAATCRGTARRVATTLAEVHATRAAVEAIAEGFALGAYRDDRHRSDPEPALLEHVQVLVPSSLAEEAGAGVARAAAYARATCLARDLVNLPPDRKRPPDLAGLVAELLPDAVSVTVRDEGWLAEHGCGGLLGVGRGSAAPPRLVELRWSPTSDGGDPLAAVTLVGKGITYDSGGLSLKRGESTQWMKSDMAGAAAVVGALSALADLDVDVEVRGLLALAENLPGADAQRPGDVLAMHDGSTVEVLDTDAEGRLVLADALAYAAAGRPEAIVDLATLTGAAITAVGPHAGALMTDDDDLADALARAAGVAGEPLWRLPLWSHLEPLLDSPVADCNNLGAQGPEAGAILGGLFLKRFVGEVPWAHLDIAGPAFLRPPHAGGHLPIGGTGYGVRTLLAWLERRSA